LAMAITTCSGYLVLIAMEYSVCFCIAFLRNWFYINFFAKLKVRHILFKKIWFFRLI
jgi:hypothetical protein